MVRKKLREQFLGNKTVNEVYEVIYHPFPAREMVCVKELPLGSKTKLIIVISLDKTI